MRSELISAATQLPVSFAEVRDFLKISHGDEDALIAAYMRAATGACEQYTGRKLIAQQWQLTLNDWPNDQNNDAIEIPLSPVLSVDIIEYWHEGAFQEIAVTDYILDNTSYGARILPQPLYHWPDPDRDVAGIRIMVSAGFGAGQNDVPHDIRLGLLHWVAAAYDNGGMAQNQAVLMAEKLWQSYRRVAL